MNSSHDKFPKHFNFIIYLSIFLSLNDIILINNNEILITAFLFYLSQRRKTNRIKSIRLFFLTKSPQSYLDTIKITTSHCYRFARQHLHAIENFYELTTLGQTGNVSMKLNAYISLWKLSSFFTLLFWKC